MQVNLFEDENRTDILPEQNNEVTQVTVKTEKKTRSRSFITISLVILLLISFAATGWLYMDNKALTQAGEKILNENNTLSASLDVMEQKVGSLENQIAKARSQNKTLENRNITFVTQSQTLKAQNITLEKQNKTLLKQSQTLKAQSETLEKQNKTLAEQSQMLEEQNEKVVTNIGVLNLQLDKAGRVYRRRLAELQAKNDKLTAENTALSGK